MHTSGSIKYNDGISDDILPSNDNGHSSFFFYPFVILINVI